MFSASEVGPDVLGRVQAVLTHKMSHAIEGQPDDRGIRVAFLSTIQFDATRHLWPFPNLIRPVQKKDPIFDKAGYSRG